MKRLKNIGLWTAALLLLASCSKIAEPCYEKENKEVQLKIAIDGLSAQSRAVATEADEAYIGTVQLFIFPVTADKSGVAERIVTLNTEKGTTDDMQNTWNSATGIFTLRGVTGRKTVYVVANGTAANGYDPATFAVGTTTQADLDNIVTERRGNVVTPVAGASGLLMAGSGDVDFTANSTATIDLVRQVAKIKLHVTFDKTFSDSYPAMKFGEASIAPATVTACNVPTHSYLLALPTPELPAATLFGDYKAIDFVHIGAETDRVWQTDVYVYENPQTGDSQADKRLSTQFVVSIPYTDGTTATVYDNSYLVYINDPAAAASPHKTLRNIQYRINVTVKGFGSGAPDIEKATFITEVLPWNVVNSNGSVVGNYLKISNAEYIIFERPQLQLPYVPIATVGHNIAGTHTGVVSVSGTGLSLQGTLDPNDSQGTIVLPDEANLPTSIDSKLAQKDIIVNMRPEFTSGTVKVDLGGQFHQDIKITRAPYQADGAYERYDLGTGFVFIPADANSEWMQVSTATAWSASMATVSGTVSETAHLYVYVKRSIDSGAKGVGFNAVRKKVGSTEKFTVRCSYLLPQIGSLLIARRDLIGRKSWGNAMGRYAFENPNTTLVGSAMGGAPDGCNTLGSGWRIPTEPELRSIHNKQVSIIAQVGGQFLADYFWTCTENNATSAKIIPFYGNSATQDHLKTGTISMRCVKNL